MAQEKEEEEDEDEDENEDKVDRKREQEPLEVHDSMYIVQLAAEPGQQEGWEEWALPKMVMSRRTRQRMRRERGSRSCWRCMSLVSGRWSTTGSPARRRMLKACAASAHQKQAASGVLAKPKCLHTSPTGCGDPHPHQEALLTSWVTEGRGSLR